jgi:hypothetical protein
MRTPLRLLAVGSVLLLVGCSGDARDNKSRDAAFQDLFGFAPLSDVIDVKSSWRKNFSTYVCWIRVSCGVPTISKIRSHGRSWPDRFVILTIAPGAHAPAANSPPWWNDANLAAEPERFVLPRSTSAKLDMVYVWVDAGRGAVYAARNVAK